MIKTNEQYIDHETRIRILENIAGNINKTLLELKSEVRHQFHWTLGLIFLFLGSVVLPIATSEIIGLIRFIKAGG
jgi:hypothetical protein